MKNEMREQTGPTKPLTPDTLQKLKNKGFKYVQVNGFSSDKRLDYMEPKYFVLVPLKELPDDIDRKGIYEPIDSTLLMDWANLPQDNISVLMGAGSK